MTKEEVYDAWTPPESPWTPWCKTILFSYLREQDLQAPMPHVERWDLPPRMTEQAIIVDANGTEGLSIGLALCFAARFRPIPIYNACPFATYNRDSISSFAHAPEAEMLVPPAVDVTPIMSLLAAAAAKLEAANLPADAPPAFLLDGNRNSRGPVTGSDYGWFDNRSFVTTSDFPSAQALRERGLSKIILIQPNSRIRADLLEVLLAWQRDGITIWRHKPWASWNPILMKLKRPFILLRLWNRIRRAIGFRENQFGPFGRFVPPSSSS